MQGYTSNEAYSLFLNYIFLSREDLGAQSADPEKNPETAEKDNFLNSYLAATLTSRLSAKVKPARIEEISTIVGSDEGPRLRVLRLQREADQGLIFHGVFTETPKDYETVGIAYSSAAGICNKLQDSTGEIFAYIDENLDFCIGLLHHLSIAYLAAHGVSEAQLHRMTLAQTPDESLDSFLDYYHIYLNETDQEKRNLLVQHLQESREVAQQLNPKLIFPIIE